MARILIADHDPDTMQIFADTLRERGHEVTLTRSGEEALGILRNRGAEIFLLDTDLPITDGFAVMRQVFKEAVKTTVVAVVGPGEFGKGKRAMTEGAFHFLCRPLVLTELSQIIDKAAAVESLKRRLGRLGIVFLHDYHRTGDIGVATRMWSGLDANALILCENGGGGAELAELMHLSGPRKSRPFARFDCRRGKTAFEREMYGYARAAFLGAEADRAGIVEESRGGTIYLDHFEELDHGAFDGLSRLVLESKFARVGEESVRTANVRLLCCGSPNLLENRRGAPQRLLNALGVVKITIPRLRECPDIAGIAADLMAGRGFHSKSAARTLSATDIDTLKAHQWPGNLRELELALELWNLLGEWRLGVSAAHVGDRPVSIDRAIADSQTAIVDELSSAVALDRSVEGNETQARGELGPERGETALERGEMALEWPDLINAGFPGSEGEKADLPDRQEPEAADLEEVGGAVALEEVGISPSMDYAAARDLFEAAFIDFKLKQFGGNVTTTAREIGLGRRTLQEKMKKVGIDSQKYREE